MLRAALLVSSRIKYWQNIFNTVPIPMLVVDADLNVLEYNAAARPLLGAETQIMPKVKCGELLRCLNVTVGQHTCGTATACADCVIRKSVNSAVQGVQVSRQRSSLNRTEAGITRTINLLVSSVLFESEGQPRVLLMLEDVTELLALRGLLPICARCKKIRDDKKYWHALESYCHDYLSLEFTHSICPECAKELYPNVSV